MISKGGKNENVVDIDGRTEFKRTRKRRKEEVNWGAFKAYIIRLVYNIGFCRRYNRLTTV